MARKEWSAKRPVRLLSQGNTKVDKGRSEGFLTWTLMLAPNVTSGYCVCPQATSGCRRICLGSTGWQSDKKIKALHLAKTRLFFQDRRRFGALLSWDLNELALSAKREGMKPCVRLNNFSDLDWSAVARKNQDIQFYDYTKRPDLMMRFLKDNNWPANYHLTFSRSENNWADCRKVLAQGGNVAVVFRCLDDLAQNWIGYEVIDGNKHDLRFLDSQSSLGRIIALKASHAARKDKTGFVVDLSLQKSAAINKNNPAIAHRPTAKRSNWYNIQARKATWKQQRMDD